MRPNTVKSRRSSSWPSVPLARRPVSRPGGQAGRARARPARQPAAGSRCAGRAPADEPLPRAGDAAGREGRRGEPRLGGGEPAAATGATPSSCSGPAAGSPRAPRDGCGRRATSRAPGRSPSTSSLPGPLEPATRYTAHVSAGLARRAPGTARRRRHLELHHRGGRAGRIAWHSRSTWRPSRSAGTAGSSRASATSSSARRRRITGRRTT